MKISFRKIKIIFRIENWLWKSDFEHFEFLIPIVSSFLSLLRIWKCHWQMSFLSIVNCILSQTKNNFTMMKAFNTPHLLPNPIIANARMNSQCTAHCYIFQSWFGPMLIGADYGCPMKPFFIEIQNFWAWADKLIG